jgi:hypothetical protein
MPTDNKKISAYVPDVIYDRFIQYKDERGLSMSQVAIEIFATYFGINLNPTISNESTGELLSRVDTLEKELSGLKTYLKLLSGRVDLMQSNSEPLISKPLEVFADKDIRSKPDSSLQDEPPKEDIIEQPIAANIIGELDSSSDSELPIIESLEVPVDKDIDSKLDSNLSNELPQEHIVEQGVDIIDKPESSSLSELLSGLSINNTDELVDNNSELLSSLPSEIETNYSGRIPFPESNSLPVEPLKSELLAKRIDVVPQTLVNQKSKFKTNDIEFFNWLQFKDPDGIRWIAVPQKKGVKYIPDNKTSPEKLQSLKNWLDSQN